MTGRAIVGGNWAGRFSPEDRAESTWHYVDLDVGVGCSGFGITMECTPRGEAIIDLGLLGPAGWVGWSGGARDRLVITDDAATPGYLPGAPAGGWQVVLGLHRIPDAGVGVRLTFDPTVRSVPAGPDGPPVPQRPARRDLPGLAGMRWLAGDLHCHTLHSDGAHSIAEVAALARSAGLDFLAVTDHNTTSHHAHLPGAGARYGVDLIPGQEVTTWRGHANAFGDIGWVDFRRPADDWVTTVRSRGGLLSVNHPVSGDCAWRQPLVEPPPLVETWHSSWTDRRWGAPLAFRQALNPAAVPVGGADFHHHGSDAPPGSPTTWVLASDGDVLAALAAGRTAISSGPAGPLLLRMGEEFLALDADGLILSGPDGRRRVVHGDRVTLPATDGIAWLEDGECGVQAIAG